MEIFRTILLTAIGAAGLSLTGQPAGAHGAHPELDERSVGVDEKLGARIPADTAFADESGARIAIAEFADRPTLILPVYYRCKHSCGMMLGNLASILADVPLAPGKDYRTLALSIDSEDDPAVARETKQNYFKVIKRGFPGESWKFLTGDAESIRRFTESAGFRFKKIGSHDFAHPNVMIVVGRGGKIIRYLYGPTFLPFDIGMALTEAAKGTPSLSVRKLISYCFNYDPERKTYTFTAVRIIALAFMAILALSLFFLIRKKKV